MQQMKCVKTISNVAITFELTDNRIEKDFLKSGGGADSAVRLKSGGVGIGIGAPVPAVVWVPVSADAHASASASALVPAPDGEMTSAEGPRLFCRTENGEKK